MPSPLATPCGLRVPCASVVYLLKESSAYQASSEEFLRDLDVVEPRTLAQVVARYPHDQGAGAAGIAADPAHMSAVGAGAVERGWVLAAGPDGATRGGA